MARKVALLPVSLLTVAVLLLVSCGSRASAPTPSAPIPTAPTPAVPTPATPTPAVPTPTLVEKPKYGGTMTFLKITDFTFFLPGLQPGTGPGEWGGWIYQHPTWADQTKGPLGTGETEFGSGVTDWKYVTGFLVESFEIPRMDTWILNVRRGIHWALDPNNEASRLANGRELTADDFVFSFRYAFTTPTHHTYLSVPGLARNATAEQTGPWQVTVKTPVDASVAWLWLMGGGFGMAIHPRDVVEKFWKTNEWRHMVGTGPYTIVDYVSGSGATLKRNPNYWEKMPVGPGKGDQLPYIDTVKRMVVPDISTRLAIMRTNKAEYIDEVTEEDAQSLFKTNPNLRYYAYPFTPSISMRMDKQDLPFRDKRVRQALQMALDMNNVKEDFYGGNAEILAWPIGPPQAGTKLDLYVPLEKLPEQVQALYKYNPERAKQLLAEAGYPNGFKTKVVVRSTGREIDEISLVKAMWTQIGVDLEIQPKESGVYNQIYNLRTYDQMIYRTVSSFVNITVRYAWDSIRGPQRSNQSYIDDPVIEAAYKEMQTYIYTNMPKADEIVKGIMPYLLEQAYYVVLPSPNTYRIWQPWVKSYFGESAASSNKWIQYPWIDQDLKEKMTGRR